MNTTETAPTIDSLVQQTWKRARTSKEIGAFLARRELALQAVESDELDFEV